MASSLPVRHRYVFTRHNTVRLRYMIGPAFAVMFLTMGAGASFIPRAGVDYSASIQIASSGLIEDTNFIPEPYREEEDAALAAEEQSQTGTAPESDEAAAQTADASPQPRDRIVKIGRGDTLDAVLVDAGVSSTDAYNAIQALRPHFDPRSITPGQKLSLHFDPAGDSGTYSFSRLTMPVSLLSTVQLSRNEDGSFSAAVDRKQAVRKLYARKADVDVSLFGSALEARIPSSIVAKAIRIYSWNVDFQRDIQPGDRLQVLYEQYETPDGTPVRAGEIVYASLTVNGNDNAIYRYQTKDGDIDYFNADGISVRKALLSTPVDGARMSSGYGMRHHPILGYTRMHKGVDFAGPVGTPIYAAGNGLVEKVGRFSTYGNYVRIRHNSTLKTAYAHMQHFAAGLRGGMRVKQGQVIGYIGTTGRSTGPHLHYEVMINDEQVNPRGVKVAQGEALRGAQLASFKSYVRSLYRGYETMLAQKYAAIVPASGRQNRVR